ncbi:FAD-binding oxidoreductase [Leptolyngbya sp. FACHB-261]|uniref:NAD(P)/FAD-dependent oxidoreductase n=1 Tax=Leptolyngbya sp. FACHB-261 TaxID=2692806 RepID=UPI0016860BAA|nr:FAD-binding oxidoreductase [Leptolyngbya sp. FACHB-261]MBD2102648.1 FAD-binding oxidoreductase [Leptolyngbya sp. FACHB-261]
MTETADIVVVGGGSIGASVALHLAERKAGKIILLERRELASGASGKGIGIIRTHYTHPVLAELAQQSLRTFHEFKERFGGHESGFNPCGYFVLVPESETETLERIVTMHQRMGINVSLVDPKAVQALVPQLAVDDVAAVAHEPDSGYGSPPQTTLALARRAAELGVELCTQTPVLEIKLDLEGRVQGVSTPAGDIVTRTVVDCVGPWAKKFTEHLGLEFPVKPVVEHVVVVERPTAFAQHHPVISDLVNLAYSRSDPDQPYTRIGNSNPKYHQQFALEDADEFQGQIFPEICENLYKKLGQRCPSFQQAPIVETYSGIWGVTPDYQPILDHLDHVPGLYCAVGFSGHGYKLSPVVGDLMSRFILGERDGQVAQLRLFRFGRFKENDLIKAPLSYAQAGGLR